MLAPKIIKGGDKNGELDREAALEEQYYTGKLLCGGVKQGLEQSRFRSSQSVCSVRPERNANGIVAFPMI